MENRNEFRERLTKELIESIKNGTAPWQRPWKNSAPELPYNPITEKQYRGANSLWLSMQNHSDSRWMTYKQALENGWQVRKGEKGTLIEYWKIFDEQEEVKNGITNIKKIQLERPQVFRAVVFNAEQIDNIPPADEPMRDWDRHEKAEGLLKRSGAFIRHDQHSRAFYRPASDSIHLPQRSQFNDADGYYATALHELGHWTGHHSRLDRDQRGAYGSADYAKEELRAEIGAYFLCAALALPNRVEHHASYIDIWCHTLNDDHNEIFRAARDAWKIQEFLNTPPLTAESTPSSRHTEPRQDISIKLAALGARAGRDAMPSVNGNSLARHSHSGPTFQ